MVAGLSVTVARALLHRTVVFLRIVWPNQLMCFLSDGWVRMRPCVLLSVCCRHVLLRLTSTACTIHGLVWYLVLKLFATVRHAAGTRSRHVVGWSRGGPVPVLLTKSKDTTGVVREVMCIFD